LSNSNNNDSGAEKSQLKEEGSPSTSDTDEMDELNSNNNTNDKSNNEHRNSVASHKEIIAMKESPFKFIYFNMNHGGSRQSPYLEKFLLEHDPDVLVVSDCGMYSLDPSFERTLSRYDRSVFHQGRMKLNEKGELVGVEGNAGGVTLAVKNKWNPMPLKGVLDNNNNNNSWRAAIDVASCEISISPTEKCKIFGVYVHIQDSELHLENFLVSIPEDGVVCGDMNALPDEFPKNRSIGRQSKYKDRGDVIDDFLAQEGWYIAPIHTPTVKGGQNALDHLIMGPGACTVLGPGDSIAEVIPDSEGNVCPSDHLPVSFTATVTLSVTEQSSPRNSSQLNRARPRINAEKITDLHSLEFNHIFRKNLKSESFLNRRGALAVEKSLLKADKCLPKIGGKRNNNNQNNSSSSAQNKNHSTSQKAAHNALRRLWWLDEDEVEDVNNENVDAPSSTNNTDSSNNNNSNSESSYFRNNKYRRQRNYIFTREDRKSVNPGAIYEAWNRYYSMKQQKNIVRPPLVDESDPNKTTVTESKDRVEVLAKAYARTHTSAAGVNVGDQLRQEMNAIPSEQRKGRPLAVWEIKSAIDRMKRGKCADFLGVTAEHLKLLNEDSLKLLQPYLARIVEDSVIPRHWKTATTSPVPKPNKDHSIDRSWRPVSVTAVLCRLCENIIAERIQWKLTETGIMADSQFGFRRHLPVSVPLVTLSMLAEDGISQRKNIDINGNKLTRSRASLLVGVDGVDAFCKANGAIALKILKKHGLHAEAFWVANFLSGRTLRVKEGGEMSDPVSLETGVPQGTILGPLLWSLVIDGLLKKLEEKCNEDRKQTLSFVLTFADDINFLVQAHDPKFSVAKANELLKIIDDWSKESGVPLGKMQSMWIHGLCGGDPKYDWAANWKKEDGELACGENLTSVPSSSPPEGKLERTFKLLGVEFPPSMRFIDHAHNQIKKGTKMLNYLRAISTSFTAPKVKVLYEALVLQPLLYGCECWFPYIGGDLREKFHKIHIDGCRLITRAPRQANCLGVCRVAGYRPLDIIVNEKMISLAERIKRFEGPSEWHGTGLVKKLLSGKDLPNLLKPHGETGKVFQYKKIATQHKASNTIRDVAKHYQDDKIDIDKNDIDFLPDGRPVFPDLDKVRLLDEFIPYSAFDCSPPGGLSKKTSDFRDRHFENRQRVDALLDADPDGIYVYCDGGCEGGSAGLISGGAVIYHKGEILTQLGKCHARFGCSYTAEIRTIHMALEWMKDNLGSLFPTKRPRIYIISDSLSSISALSTGPLRQDALVEQGCWRLLLVLAELKFPVSFHFVFSHSGLDGNEVADVIATSSLHMCRLDENLPGPTWRKDGARIRKYILRKQYDALFAEEPPNDREWEPEDLDNGSPRPLLKKRHDRRDEQLLYRARVGCIPEIGGHLHEAATTNNHVFTCPLCREANALGRSGKTIRHIIRCPRSPIPETDEYTFLKQLYQDEYAALHRLRVFRAAKVKFVAELDKLEKEAKAKKKEDKRNSKRKQKSSAATRRKRRHSTSSDSSSTESSSSEQLSSTSPSSHLSASRGSSCLSDADTLNNNSEDYRK